MLSSFDLSSTCDANTVPRQKQKKHLLFWAAGFHLLKIKAAQATFPLSIRTLVYMVADDIAKTFYD